MRAQIPVRQIGSPFYGEDFQDESDVCRQVLRPLLDLAKKSADLIAGSVGVVAVGRDEFRIPRFILMGPKGGGDTIRLGMFATFHGDEPEGAEALIELLRELERTPDLAKGCHIYAYPVCNPAGFVAGSRNSASGADLAGQFWRGSRAKEVYYLEREMGVHQFHGVISLHTVKATHFGARTRSPLLQRLLVRPALSVTREFFPATEQPSSEFAAFRLGGSDSIPVAFLTDTDELRRHPFEINFGIPGQAPKVSQIQGTVGALKSVLENYRALLATGQNI